MPPIQQQQTSRGGLIAALVVSIVFAVGFLIWAFMSNADLTRAQNENLALKTKYGKVIGEGSLGNIGDLQGQMSLDPEKPRTVNLVDAAIEQRNSLVRLISGAEGTEKKATDDVLSTIAALKDPKMNPALQGVAIPENAGLTAIVKTLADKAKNDADAVKKANDDLKSANQQLQAGMASQKDEIAKRDAAVAEAQAAMNKAVADAKAAIDDKQKQVDDFSAKAAASDKAMTDRDAEVQVQTQTLQRSLAKAKSDYEALLGKFAQYRPNVKDSIVRNVDATITQVAPDSVCYINLGFGDHVSPGLTFEVYDKFEGIPKIGDGTSSLDMPKGKASLEIISVGQNSSQCRVLGTKSGATVAQGDLCANLVYDKNIKPVFYVYGKFDMDQNGVATEAEAEVIKNLITRWGGKISDKVNIDVDFVVFGKEPTIPTYSAEELAQPLQKAKADEAKAALEAYNKIRDEAVSLHIPVMNQNRFLYYTGYFDSSKK
ncbi:MAG: hypothetical protein JWN40_5489 [Phycisphaerales bacterium]|nr:hypothetical protein [Phycisphaerales bacterium]